MTIDIHDMMNSIIRSVSRIDYIKPEDIPGIDLYMDQVTTFMESQLASSKRYPDDKILTKTMINNYAKNNLPPLPGKKKKYSRVHLLLLIFNLLFQEHTFPSTISRPFSAPLRRNISSPTLRWILPLSTMRYSAWRRDRSNI